MIHYIEDDKNIRELVLYTLTQIGYDALGFANADAFWPVLEQQAPELLLLDIMLPGQDGISVLSQLRANERTRGLPIIMITAKGSEYDTVTALDCGADDYISKPFGMIELVSRIKAVLRRTTDISRQDIISVGKLQIDKSRHAAFCDGVALTLSYKEFALLQFLLENTGRVFTRDQLLEAVWGYNYAGGTRTVDVHIQTLRQKLGECANFIETVRGVGYRAQE